MIDYIPMEENNMKKYIKSADEKVTLQDRIGEIQDGVEDDFSYILAGIDKMVRDGGESTDRALSILGEISDSLQGFIDVVAGEVRE